jgi:hypothetical protein
LTTFSGSATPEVSTIIAEKVSDEEFKRASKVFIRLSRAEQHKPNKVTTLSHHNTIFIHTEKFYMSNFFHVHPFGSSYTAGNEVLLEDWNVGLSIPISTKIKI